MKRRAHRRTATSNIMGAFYVRNRRAYYEE